MARLSLSGQTKQRQIVILAAGGAVLGGLLLFQLPKTLDRMNASAPASTTETTPAAPTTPQPTAPTGAPVVPVAPTPAPRRALLSRFEPKDPFVQQVDADTSEAPAASAPGTPVGAAPAPARASSAAARASSARSSGSARASFTVESFATIAVNGGRQRVRVSAAFPKADPVFRLVSARGNTARVGIAGGNLTGGSQTVTLTRGEPVTLLNTLDGKRYRLELLSVSS
jgi:hypothetical protein